MNNQLNAFRFALAGGIWLGLCYLAATVFSLINVPGFIPFVELLKQFYGSYGYSVTWGGAIIGGFWGFVEGFIHLGFLVLVYNRLSKKNN